MTTGPQSTVSGPLRNTRVLLAIGLALAGVVIFFGNYDVDKGENGGTSEAIVSAAICLVLAGVLFFYVVPRVGDPDSASLALAIVGIVTIVVFWLGVTPLFAAAALAIAARATATRMVTRVFLALAVAAALASVVVTVASNA